MSNTASHTQIGQARSPRPDDRRREHVNDALGLLERLRLASKNGELPSTAQLQREGAFGLRPVNRIGDLRKGKNLATYYDIGKIKCGCGVYRSERRLRIDRRSLLNLLRAYRDLVLAEAGR